MIVKPERLGFKNHIDQLVSKGNRKKKKIIKMIYFNLHSSIEMEYVSIPLLLVETFFQKSDQGQDRKVKDAACTSI